MTARFIPSQYPGGRILLRSGQVDVGAIFPPAGNNPGRNPWVWRLWIWPQAMSKDGRAASELAAKNAMLRAWADTCQRLGLVEVSAESAG